MLRGLKKTYGTASFTMAIIAIVTGFLWSCLEPYSPKESFADVNILVIDGFLDSFDGSALVTLSKASPLITTGSTPRVSFANVSIESENGGSFTLVEDTAGVYTAAVIPVDPATRYRLRVQTDGKEYESDYVRIKPTPQIDSVTHRFSGDGTTILVNSHDDTGNTRYYRWDYTETWEYNARLYSSYKIVDKVPVPRAAGEFIYKCYRTTTSTRILTNSTVQLQNDVVSAFPLVQIQPASSKLYIRYSVLVKQRALDEDEYTFLDQLKKTTEGIGTLFDPQPSQVLGNVHNLSDGPEPLGYFSAGNTTQKRLFITYAMLPDYLRRQNLANCPLDTICVFPRAFLTCAKQVGDITGDEFIIEALSAGGPILGYTASSAGCVDCRLAGGVLQKPSFWP